MPTGQLQRQGKPGSPSPQLKQRQRHFFAINLPCSSRQYTRARAVFNSARRDSKGRTIEIFPPQVAPASFHDIGRLPFFRISTNKFIMSKPFTRGSGDISPVHSVLTLKTFCPRTANANELAAIRYLSDQAWQHTRNPESRESGWYYPSLLIAVAGTAALL